MSKKIISRSSKRKKIDIIDDSKEISNLSDDLSNLSIHETKKKQKISIQKLSDTYLDKKFIANFNTLMKDLYLNSKKRGEYKFNTRFPLYHKDDMDNSYVAILPIVIGYKNFKQEEKKSIHGISRENKRILEMYDIIISSFLYDRKGNLIFYPKSYYDEFIENDENDDGEEENNIAIKSKWENLDNDIVLKMFKKQYNIDSKKKKNILGKKYVKYSPNIAIYIVFLKKEYLLKNLNFGDKHFQWALYRQFILYNDWVPYEFNMVNNNYSFKRSGDPYIYRLISDTGYKEYPNVIKCIIRDLDAEKNNKEYKKTLPYHITYKYIHEEIAKFNKSRGGFY